MILFFAWLNIFEISMAVRMCPRGAYRLSLTHDELTLFCVNRSLFEESTCIGTSSKLDKILLGWFDDNSERLLSISLFSWGVKTQRTSLHFTTWSKAETALLPFTAQSCEEVPAMSRGAPAPGNVSWRWRWSKGGRVSAKLCLCKSSAWDSYRYLEAIAHDFESLTEVCCIEWCENLRNATLLVLHDKTLKILAIVLSYFIACEARLFGKLVEGVPCTITSDPGRLNSTRRFSEVDMVHDRQTTQKNSRKVVSLAPI